MNNIQLHISIYADLKMEKESKYYSSWAIPSIDEWNKIFNNLTGTKIGQYISRQKWNSFHRLNVKLDAFPRFASFTNGHVNIIFYSEKQQCFLYNGSSVSKIRGIAAF